MGLTVHFKLTVAADLPEDQARKLVASMHRRALRFQRKGSFDQVCPIASHRLVEDRPWFDKFATHWRVIRNPGQTIGDHVEVTPKAGFLFPISVGKDCEPLWVGLCRYPAEVYYPYLGKNVRTLVGNGWRFSGFSKTQFASLHGWEYFQRCHCAIVDFLAACQSPELKVKISDEGEYWPRRSLAKLRQNLDQMNGIVAAAAGAMRDCFPDAKGENAVQSPMFDHPQFERLEAEGAQRVGAALHKLTTVIKKK